MKYCRRRRKGRPSQSLAVYLADWTGSGWQDCLKAGRTALLVTAVSVARPSYLPVLRPAGCPHVPGELRWLPMQSLSRLVSLSVSHSVSPPCCTDSGGSDCLNLKGRPSGLPCTDCLHWPVAGGQGHRDWRQADRDVSPE